MDLDLLKQIIIIEMDACGHGRGRTKSPGHVFYGRPLGP